MKVGFLGVTVHWIGVKERKWVLNAAVIGLKEIVGTHKGDNLGRYIIGLCDRVGITSKEHSKVRDESHASTYLIGHNRPLQLFAVTLDNTSSNATTCEAVQYVHSMQDLDEWDAGVMQHP